uniref:Uncharacterized protein n=1 Tax=viral metagenome TaxID=1070528 RepID=A0A6C0KVW9_9ZZZZ
MVQPSLPPGPYNTIHDRLMGHNPRPIQSAIRGTSPRRERRRTVQIQPRPDFFESTARGIKRKRHTKKRKNHKKRKSHKHRK